MKICKKCGSEMIEDANEEIKFVGDTIIVDAFNAWICKMHCGYFEKINGNEGVENLEFKKY
jgi:hypothetical protein